MSSSLDIQLYCFAHASNAQTTPNNANGVAKASANLPVEAMNAAVTAMSPTAKIDDPKQSIRPVGSAWLMGSSPA